MGADLCRNGPTVLISGVRELIGAPVMASDLRASAGLVLAGLAGQGRNGRQPGVPPRPRVQPHGPGAAENSGAEIETGERLARTQ